MRIVILVVQVVISVAVVGLVLPGVLAFVPAARDQRVGLSIAGAIAVLMFMILRMIWPRPRQD
jgi:hypothetical protein